MPDSDSDSDSLGGGIHYPPGSFHERFSFSSESRPPTPVNVNAPINPIFEGRTRRKVDRRLIPVLAILYAITFIDATNLLIARREGADRDFNLLHENRYFFVSLVFFLPSIVLQFPLISALRRTGPVLWLGTTTFLLGALEIASGFVNGWGQFLALRIVLGVLEASILPSCIYLISTWYKRSEMQFRITMFYSSSVFFGSFGNILALALSKIHTRGTDGWRWIFALEGLVTVLLSFYGYSVVMPFPDRKHSAHTPFLTHEEVQLMRQRVEMDRRDYVPDSLDKAKFFTYLADVNLWTYAILASCANIVVYSFPLFLQNTLPNEELRNAEVQLLSASIGVVATLMVLLTGFVSLRSGMLCPLLVFDFVLGTVGLSMTGFSSRRAVRFTGCFLSYSGAQASIPIILSLQAVNIRLHSKRIFTVSLVSSFGGVGALLSVLVFPISAAPDYPAGLRTALGLQSMGVVLAILLLFRLWYKNKKLGDTLLDGGAPSQSHRNTTSASDRENAQAPQERPGTASALHSSTASRTSSLEGSQGFKYII